MTFKNKGFTLIEILVVVSIIGLLASSTLTAMNGAGESTQAARVALDIKQLENALVSFYIANGAGTWFYENICSQCYLYENLITNTDFGRYYPTAPQTPFTGAYHYDHDTANDQFVCGGDVGAGTNIFVFGGSYELYERLETAYDDDGTAECGKIRFRPGVSGVASDVVIYMLDDNI
jgi:prepilin-type N-terminal cleavage/methylation domain-containing protein